MKTESKALVAFIIVGILVGIVSWAIGKILPDNQGNFAALAVAILVLVGLPKLLEKPLGVKEKFKWWLSNGGWIYLFVWFITWIVFYTLTVFNLA